MLGFWEKLPAPFLAVAPMEDVTDIAFRRVIAHYGKPDVMWTEFTSADGLLRAQGKGLEKLRKKLAYVEAERPIVAQLFTSKPDVMREASALVRELGFDGVDINMGCPDRTVEKQGCGSALIRTPELARALIRAAKEGAGSERGGIPVSVKTRAGYTRDTELAGWVGELLAEGVAALTLHARTRKDMSKVPARWHLVREVVALRDQGGFETRIIGNGDALSRADAHAKARESGADGVMLGRAIFGNPWLCSGHVATPHERLEALMRHLAIFEAELSGITHYAVMKKHFKAYVNGWEHAADLRTKLMATEAPDEARALLTQATQELP